MKWPFVLRQSRVPDIRTARLRLRAITRDMMQAESVGDGSLEEILGARLTSEWPPVHWEPHVHELIAAQLSEQPATAGWHRYLLLRDEGVETLIGCTGGFPKSGGDVEIGYSTLPRYQRRGFATEAVGALVQFLLTQKGVCSVSAQTYPGVVESVKVMQRCGLQFAGSGEEAGALLYRRMRSITGA